MERVRDSAHRRRNVAEHHGFARATPSVSESPSYAPSLPSALRRRDAKPGDPPCSLAELHHERVASFLKQLVGEIGVATGFDYAADLVEPPGNVNDFLGGAPVHHSSTASRRMSSSMPGVRLA